MWEIVVRDLDTPRLAGTIGPKVVTYISPGSNARAVPVKWDYALEGGCDTFEFNLQRNYNDWFGLELLHDIELLIDGVARWRGFVDEIKPLLRMPETVTVMCKGYSYELDSGLISWPMTRAVLRSIGPGQVGEIAGVVGFLLLDFPVFAGRRPTDPITRTPAHPICDSIDIDQSAYRPQELAYRNDSIRRVISDLAQMAGNYEWGVDHLRRFYFKCPQPWTDGTALFSTDDDASLWWGGSKDDAAGLPAFSADPSYLRPRIDGDSLAVTAHAMVGRDIVELEETHSISSMRNAALVYTAPQPTTRFVNRDVPRAQVTVVLDSASINRFRRRRWVRLDAPGMTNSDDGAKWGEFKLQVLSDAQNRGTITLRGYGDLVPPRGSVRILEEGQVPRFARIRRVTQEFLKNQDFIQTKIDVGADPPTAAYAGKAWKQQTTLFYDRTTQEETGFVHVEDDVVAGIDNWPIPVPVAGHPG